jgi:hypothetical protein
MWRRRSDFRTLRDRHRHSCFIRFFAPARFMMWASLNHEILRP